MGPHKRRLIPVLRSFLIVNFLNTSKLSSIMSRDKVSMPSGMGGLVRYFDEYKSKIEFKPGHIIVLCVVVIVIMVLLYTYGKRLLGI